MLAALQAKRRVERVSSWSLAREETEQRRRVRVVPPRAGASKRVRRESWYGTCETFLLGSPNADTTLLSVRRPRFTSD